MNAGRDDGAPAPIWRRLSRQRHGPKLGSVADLIAYRRRLLERLVRKVEGEIEAIGGTWRILIYASTVAEGEHVVLVKGDIGEKGSACAHACLLLAGDLVMGRGAEELHAAMRAIAAAGRGVVVVLRDWHHRAFRGRACRREARGSARSCATTESARRSWWISASSASSACPTIRGRLASRATGSGWWLPSNA